MSSKSKSSGSTTTKKGKKKSSSSGATRKTQEAGRGRGIFERTYENLHNILPPAAKPFVEDPTFLTTFLFASVLALWFLWARCCRNRCSRNGGSSGGGSSQQRKGGKQKESLKTPYGMIPMFEKGDFVSVFFGNHVGVEASSIESSILKKMTKKIVKKKKSTLEGDEEGEEKESKSKDEVNSKEDKSKTEKTSTGKAESASSQEETMPSSITDKPTGQKFFILHPKMKNPDINLSVGDEDESTNPSANDSTVNDILYNEAVRDLELNGAGNFLLCKVMQTRSTFEFPNVPRDFGGDSDISKNLTPILPPDSDTCAEIIAKKLKNLNSISDDSEDNSATITPDDITEYYKNYGAKNEQRLVNNAPRLVLRTPEGKFILVPDQMKAVILDKQMYVPEVFVPSRYWKEIPNGAMVESKHSVQYKMDISTGRKMARIA